MPNTKFGNYFNTDVLHVSPKFPGLWDISSTRHLKGFGGGHLTVDTILITRAFVMVSQPHQHEFPQYLHFFSTNPYDQRDFDAEIEMTLGEDESHGEKHIITCPTALYIPAGMYHGPLNFKTINKPVLFIDIAVSGEYTRIGNTPD
jgi:predicted transcriptional regulator